MAVREYLEVSKPRIVVVLVIVAITSMWQQVDSIILPKWVGISQCGTSFS